jgi:hypothetical protein
MALDVGFGTKAVLLDFYILLARAHRQTFTAMPCVPLSGFVL